MYERSAIVLENYFSNVLGLNKAKNLRVNYEEYAQMIEKIKEYQRVLQEEERIMQKFDEVALEIEEIQKKQHTLHETSIELENERDQIFNDLSENPSTLDQKISQIEDKLDKINYDLKEIREKYVKALVIFMERQKERNKFAREHRTIEASYLETLKQTIKDFDEIEPKDIQDIKKFIEAEKTLYSQEVKNIMLKNGKNERIPFNAEVIENAVNERIKIAAEEADLYIAIYERMKKLLLELNSGNVKLAKSEKLLRDVSVKFAFLNAKKEYIVGFLDNERITSMNGKVIHKSLMEEACKNFQVDIEQIQKLYNLLIKETNGKATKKAYKELYNKTYLKEIQEKERDFQEEVTNIKINMGTVINSNYWRIEGIKNIYNTFQEEISEKFNKDLSEYKVVDLDEKKDIIEKEEYQEENKKDLDEDLDYDNIDEYDDDYNDEDIDFNSDDDNYEEDDYYDDDEYYDEDYYDDDDYDEYSEDDDYDYYDDELTEEKLDKYIERSRKNKKNSKEDKEKGLFGKLFRK